MTRVTLLVEPHSALTSLDLCIAKTHCHLTSAYYKYALWELGTSLMHKDLDNQFFYRSIVKITPMLKMLVNMHYTKNNGDTCHKLIGVDLQNALYRNGTFEICTNPISQLDLRSMLHIDPTLDILMLGTRLLQIQKTKYLTLAQV